jgi:hypothetical protein
LAQNECEKLVLQNYAYKKLQVCKMSDLQIFVITNICNQIFVTFGSIGTWSVAVLQLARKWKDRRNQ